MPSDRSGRLGRRVRSWGREVANQSRLLLAAKAAVAAALAWVLAPLLPFVDAEYAYYAPFGALISLHPTIAGSVRSGAQALGGLGLGILLGLGGIGLLLLGVPAPAAILGAAGAGVLLGGTRALGAGRDWVAISAVFVLVIGSGSIEEYPLGYLVHVAFGIVVGVLINVLIVPPLYVRQAERRLSELRDDVSGLMHGLATALADNTPDPVELDRQMRDLVATLDAVRDEVGEAEESRRGNPRGERAGAGDENLRRLRALDRTVFFLRDLVDVLERSGEDRWVADGAPANAALAAALDRAADLVGTPDGAPESLERLARADESLDALADVLDEEAQGRASAVSEELTISVCMRRIVDACRPFVTHRA